MAVAKNTLRHGVLVAMETTSYGSGTPTLSASTDGFLTYETPVPQSKWLNDGTREGISGAGTTELTPVNPSGQGSEAELVHYFKGAGAAYAASTRSSVDRLLRAFGMSATVDTTPSSEKVTYAGISTSFESIVAEIYSRGQKANWRGGQVSKLVISAEGMVVPKWTFSAFGIQDADPSDSAVPAITYPGAALKNAKAVNIGMTIDRGGTVFTGIPRSWTLTIEREMTERTSQNDANGNHMGVELGARSAMLEVMFEATSLVASSPHVTTTAIDPYRLYRALETHPVLIDMNVGAAQYNRFKVQAPTAIVSGPPNEESDGPIALWGINFKFFPSADGLEDDFTIVTD